jgi:adenylate cyclase
LSDRPNTGIIEYMSRPDCISNRNIKIIFTYTLSKLGSCESLFEGLPFPANEYTSPEDFFLNEDEWTTYENFERIFRQAKELVGESDFFFKCGASSAGLRSWGRFHYFVRIFATPDDGFERLPFFNKNFDDTKEIEILLPPAFERNSKRIRTILKVEFHKDFDPHKDYIGDPYLRGIISSIPTIWGLPPASIRQPLNPYNPEVLFNEEPEFASYRLDVAIQGDTMTLKHPASGQRLVVGGKVILEPEFVNGQRVFLGKHRRNPPGNSSIRAEEREAIIITQDIQVDGRTLLRKGEIFKAPYFILDITYDRLSPSNRISQLFRLPKPPQDSGYELIDTINQLRLSIKAKNQAYLAIETTNEELRQAKASLDEVNRQLEQKVEDRTEELRKAQQDLLRLTKDQESEIRNQLVQLEKYNELRRYLSPKLTDKILNSGQGFAIEPKRKMITVVFTDIRGFSDVTDGLEPEESFHLLNRYLSEMIKIVHLYDGTLNKILGDGLLIFFGDPIPVEDHARRALSMAIDMQKQVDSLRQEWLQYGHELAVGIGINTGYVTIGNIGSDTHRDYTVIGNQVNVAGRLVSLAKAGQILISHRTYSLVKDDVKVEEVGDIQVKGIHTPVKTYSVLW